MLLLSNLATTAFGPWIPYPNSGKKEYNDCYISNLNDARLMGALQRSPPS